MIGEVDRLVKWLCDNGKVLGGVCRDSFGVITGSLFFL